MLLGELIARLRHGHAHGGQALGERLVALGFGAHLRHPLVDLLRRGADAAAFRFREQQNRRDPLIERGAEERLAQLGGSAHLTQLPVGALRLLDHLVAGDLFAVDLGHDGGQRVRIERGCRRRRRLRLRWLRGRLRVLGQRGKDTEKDGDSGGEETSRHRPQAYQVGGVSQTRRPSRSSALNPGPNAAISESPGRPRPASAFSSTNSTLADDRFPTSRNVSRDKRQVFVREPEEIVDGVEDLAPARVEEEVAQVAAADAVLLEEGVDGGGQLALEELRHALVENDRESLIGDAEPHHLRGVVEEVGAGVEDLEAAAVAPHQRRRAAVAEQRRRYQVRHREIAQQVGHRRDLDRDDGDLVVGIRAQVIVRAGERHRSRRAAELGEGQASHVGAQTEVVDQVGVERRDHETGAGGGDEDVDLLGPRRSLLQQVAEELDAEAAALLDVDVVAPFERAMVEQDVDVANQPSRLDAGVVEQRERLVEERHLAVEEATGEIAHLLALELVRRQRGGDAVDEAQGRLQRNAVVRCGSRISNRAWSRRRASARRIERPGSSTGA